MENYPYVLGKQLFPMETEGTQPKGTWLMPEPSFRRYSLSGGSGVLGLYRKTMFEFIFFTYDIKIIIYLSLFLLFVTFYVA